MLLVCVLALVHDVVINVHVDLEKIEQVEILAATQEVLHILANHNLNQDLQSFIGLVAIHNFAAQEAIQNLVKLEANHSLARTIVIHIVATLEVIRILAVLEVIHIEVEQEVIHSLAAFEVIHILAALEVIHSPAAFEFIHNQAALEVDHSQVAYLANQILNHVLTYFMATMDCILINHMVKRFLDQTMAINNKVILAIMDIIQ